MSDLAAVLSNETKCPEGRKSDESSRSFDDIFLNRQRINAPFELYKREFPWVFNYHLFLEKGYRLRERYEPGWIGSWVKRGVSVEDVPRKQKRRYKQFEDSIPIVGPVVPAVRISDGRAVVLKLIVPPAADPEAPGILHHSLHNIQEVEIMKFLASTAVRDDPHNPYPLLLDSFEVPGIGTILVPPLLRDCQIPRIRLVVECLAVMRQVLEQLVFLHDHNIAHRDIRIENIMMDPDAMYPNGMNPLINYCQHNKHLPPEPKPKDRLDVTPRYHLIDYSYSVMFPSLEARSPVITTGARWMLDEFFEIDAEDGTETPCPHDPFKADIKAFAVTFTDLFPKNIPFLEPLFDACFQDPDLRPDARTILKMFHDLTANLSRAELLCPCYQWNRTNRVGWTLWSGIKHALKQQVRHKVEYGRLVVKAVIKRRDLKF